MSWTKDESVARELARTYSIKYGSWLVVRSHDGWFSPWAHVPDERSAMAVVAEYVNGREFSEVTK